MTGEFVYKYGRIISPDVSNDLVFILNETQEYYECLQLDDLEPLPALLVMPRSLVRLETGVDANISLLEPSSDSLLTILGCAMKDWIPLLQEVLNTNQSDLYNQCSHTIQDLTHLAKLCLSESLTIAEERQTRAAIISKLNMVNHQLGLDSILFEDGQVINTNAPLRIYELYMDTRANEQDVQRNIQFQFQQFIGTVCKSGDVELQFCVYDTSRNEPLSEPFTILIDSNGSPLHGQLDSCVFEDIQFKGPLYLLAKIVSISTVSPTQQKSDLLSVVKKKLSRNNLVSPEERLFVRQPVGYALFSLTEAFQSGQLYESHVSISLISESSDGKDWSKPSTAVLPSISERIGFSLQIVKPMPILDKRVSIPPSGLPRLSSPAQDTNKVYITLQNGVFNAPKSNGFSCEVTCQLRFPDGTFVEGGMVYSETMTNLSEFKSVVIPNCTEPFWNDTFQIVIPPSELATVHLFFTFKNAGKVQEGKIFAFAFMPLVQSKNVILNDGVHELTLYRYEERLAHPSNYLSFPAGPNLLVPVHLSLSSVTSIASAAQASSKLPALGHAVFVQSRLFSTHFSQDINVVNFIQWKRTDSMNRSPLVDVIVNLQNVGEVDMTNMCKPIFAAFIDLFFEMGPDLYATLFDIVLPVKYEVMDTFIIFLTAVMDSEPSKQRQVLEHEISKKSLYRSHLPMLTNLFSKVVEDANTPELGKTFRRMVKVWGYIVRGIINACKDDLARAFEACEAVFTSVDQFFKASPTPQILASQTIAIQHLDSLFSELRLFNEEQRIGLVLNTLQCIDLDASGLRTHYLKLLNRLARDPGFVDPKTLGPLFNSVLKLTMECYRKDFVMEKATNNNVVTELAIDVANSCLSYLKGIDIATRNEIVIYIPLELWGELLFLSLRTQNGLRSRTSTADSQVISKLVYDAPQTTAAGLLFIAFGDLFDLEFLVHTFKAIRNAKTFRLVVHTVKQFIQKSPFYHQWIILDAVAGSALENILTAMYRTVTDFSDPVVPLKSVVGLYGEILDVGAMLLFSHYFGIGSVSFQRSRILHVHKAGLRLSLSTMLLEAVRNVNQLRAEVETPLDFPIAIVYRLFAAVVGPESNVRFFAVDLLYEIFKTEYSAMGSFRFIEHLCFSQFHDLISSKQISVMPNEFLNGFFVKTLLFKFDGDQDEFGSLGRTFLKSLKKFVTNLSGECKQDQNDDYVTALMRMLRFLKAIKHKGLFVTYVHQLYQYHLSHKNYVEAAMALMQESELLQWRTNVYIENAAVYSLSENCTEFELNEQIHLTCIKLLDMAQYWERALDLTRILEHQYGLKVHDYQKLSAVLKIRVTLYEKIFQEHRTFPTYFRVAFFGDGFGENNGKQFIYRGDNWEQLGSFCERLKAMYDPVSFNHSKAPFDTSTLTHEDRVIQLNVVDPVSDIRAWNCGTADAPDFRPLGWSIERKSATDFKEIPLFLFTTELYWDDIQFQELAAIKERIPPYVKSYYENNEVCMFSLSRPFKREEYSDVIFEQNAKEFANLWIEKTIFFTDYSLPCLSRRSKVIQTMTFEVSPIENAIITMRVKTKELINFETKYRQYSQRNTIDTMSFSAPADSKWSIDTAVSNPSSSSDLSTPLEININPFSMALQGAIDAPVNGGVSLYKAAFLNNLSYQKVGNQQLCKTLETAIMEQIEVISRCIPLHGELVPPSMRPFHKEMMIAFEKNFAQELAKLRLENKLLKKCNLSIAPSSSGSSFNSSKLQARLSLVSKNSKTLSLARHNSLNDLIEGYAKSPSPEPTAKRSSTPLNAFSRLTLSIPNA